MLEVRIALAPAYTFAAVQHNAEAVSNFLQTAIAKTSEDENSFAQVDWDLHHNLAVLSTNPIFTLILNGFREYYQLLAVRYFSVLQTRQNSLHFYTELQQAALENNPEKARDISQRVMQESLDFWTKMEMADTR